MSWVRHVLVICFAVGVTVFAMPSAVSAAGAWAWPLRGQVALEYGAQYVDQQGRSCSHGGIDIAASAGAAIDACAPGKVTFSGLVPAGVGLRAWAVTVLTTDGLRVTYLPLERASVKLGEGVAAGDKLGELSGSGDTSSPAAHLHLGVHRGETALDPRSLLGAVQETAPSAPAPVPTPAGPPAGPVSSLPVGRVPVPAARTGGTAAARTPVRAPSPPITSAHPAPVPLSAPAHPSPLLPSALMPGLESLQRIAPVENNPRVRTAAVSADVGRLRDLLAAALVRLAIAGAAGACVWPVLRNVLNARRDSVPAPTAIRRSGA